MRALQYGIIDVVNRFRKGETVVKVTKEENKGERNGHGNKQNDQAGTRGWGWKEQQHPGNYWAASA